MIRALLSSALVFAALARASAVEFAFKPDERMLGDRNAALILVEFADFTCRYSRQFARESLPKIKQDLVEKGKLLFVYRYLPRGLEDPIVEASQAAECARVQGAFWPMHDKLFAREKPATTEELKALAGELKLDQAKFASCIDDPQSAKPLLLERAQAERLGMDGTPSFLLIDRRPGAANKSLVIPQFITYEQLLQAIADNAGESPL